MRKVQAIFENGVLRPVEPLGLHEHQLVSLILLHDAAAEEELSFVPAADFEPLADRSCSIDAVRRALSQIPGALDADFFAERNER